MFEWCSISVMSEPRPPAPTFARPHEYATRLIASVALRVKIEQAGSQPTNSAIRVRADSKASVDSRAELVHAAVDRRVGVALELVHRLDHLARPLGRGGRVEVGDAPAVEHPVQHREVGPDVDERVLGGRGHQVASARSPMNSRTWSSAPCSFSATRRRTSSARVLEPLHDLLEVALDHDAHRLGARDAAGHHVEDLLGVELADGAPVRGLHVVDLHDQRRDRVALRLRRAASGGSGGRCPPPSPSG